MTCCIAALIFGALEASLAAVQTSPLPAADPRPVYGWPAEETRATAARGAVDATLTRVDYGSPLLSPPPIDAYADGAELGLPHGDATFDTFLEEKPSDRKPGVFQGIGATGTWIPSPSTGEFGIADVDAYVTLGLPLGEKAGLLVTPGFAVYWLDGPTTPDLPARIYDATTDVRLLGKLTDRLAVDLSVTPGLYTDFQQNKSEAFRLPSRALGVLQWTPQVRWVAGVLYLDRSDVNWLPAGGVMWTIDEQTQLDVLFPRPKFARQFWVDGWVEHWWYLAGEFGGDSYFIERAGGVSDTITLRDYRLLYGVERRSPGGIKGRLEVGYVFGRTIEYDSGTPDFHPDDAFLVRGGVSY